MEYRAEEMLLQGKLATLFQSGSKEEQQAVLRLVEALVKENGEYTDSRNYGHLCSLFPAIAYCRLWEGQGLAQEECFARLEEAIHAFVLPQIEKMQAAARLPGYIASLKQTMPQRLNETNGFGWEVEFPPCGEREFIMLARDCLYCRLCKKYRLDGLAAAFCHIDDWMYGSLPAVEFYYTQRIGCGGTVCDYHFRAK